MQKNIDGTVQNWYDVTVTRTGSVMVKAANCEEAYDIVNAMSASEINDKGNLTGWEPSDAELVERGE
ncbi:hypothetical protein [Ructibacterium gallinarum]|uniref:Uncharacterized protein n=1 Tax=Ructibacterium gallinarum TaxID=2779355 RepID=A0A9D5M6R2_9FIRM|nr:hypothetical protein [Ructibacterium gallinarum]MBE5040532.1 hypothetical protein [Ructibacterium gallinarum]